MHTWVVQTESILSGNWTSDPSERTNAAVAQRFDAWCQQLRHLRQTESLTDLEGRCLDHFLKVSQNMRSHLIWCYDRPGLPRTNNDLERFIRAIKTRYRRISGRKNWNQYLLRYGSRAAYYEAAITTGETQQTLAQRIHKLGRQEWQLARAEQRTQQDEQLKKYRFRHKRSQFLAALEDRWAQTVPGTVLLL